MAKTTEKTEKKSTDRLNIVLDTTLKRRFKAKCGMEGLDMSWWPAL
jgi:hypothetical protein